MLNEKLVELRGLVCQDPGLPYYPHLARNELPHAKPWKNPLSKSLIRP